ncbi:FMN-linked oxidoreductase [Phanerochaete sordida]|uniref:FMN-linked oxidoreductase n=1 Tax=Phanerochaete sordida TaxID=48140 RepID=A0A9P3FZR4_9APHY|nr:FMN-linked oxidoreductase [Phanerochaete sordida]
MPGHADGEASDILSHQEPPAVAEPDAALLSPVPLPCGLTSPNRLVKVAMYEHLAALFGGPPNAQHYALYSKWAQGSWGIIMTGNVQVDSHHLSLGRDMVVPPALTDDAVAPFKALAHIIHGEYTAEGPLAIMQLSHCGRQSANILGGRWPFVSPLAPSALRLDLDKSPPWTVSGLLSRLMFQTPREMSRQDIEGVVRAFARGAHLALRSGFDGVEIHAGHGYLIAEFISPQSNVRMDEYSSSTSPLRLLSQVVLAIREVVPPRFAIGIKLNAADYAQGSCDEDLVLQHVREIAEWRTVDFIEVSGGNYENPEFISGGSGSKRQAIFSRFSKSALRELEKLQEASPGLQRPLVLLTGGLSSVDVMTSALDHNHADLLGIGRLSVLCPHLPSTLKEPARNHLEPPALVPGIKPWDMEPLYSPTSWHTVEMVVLLPVLYLWNLIPTSLRPRFPRLIGAGAEMAWYTVAMRNLAAAGTPDYRHIYAGPGLGAVVRMWLYVAPGDWSWLWLLAPVCCAASAALYFSADR